MCYMILLLQQFTAFYQPKSGLKKSFCELAYQKLPLKKKGFRAVLFWRTSSFVKIFFLLLLAFQVYVNPSVWFFLTLQAHFVCLCCHWELLANTHRRKLPMFCLVSLFLFKLLAKAPRLFLSALLCFSLIRPGATGKGKLRKTYQN